MTFDGKTLNQVGLRLKQGFGTATPLEGKAGFSIKTDEFVTGQNFRGVKRFTLGSSLDDPSFVAEPITYEVFRARRAFPPSAWRSRTCPSTASSWVSTPCVRCTTAAFLARNALNPDGNLYEGSYDIDMSDPRIEACTNETSNFKSDVKALATVVNGTPNSEYLAGGRQARRSRRAVHVLGRRGGHRGTGMAMSGARSSRSVPKTRRSSWGTVTPTTTTRTTTRLWGSSSCFPTGRTTRLATGSQPARTRWPSPSPRSTRRPRLAWAAPRDAGAAA